MFFIQIAYTQRHNLLWIHACPLFFPKCQFSSDRWFVWLLYILCIFGTVIGKLGTGMHIAWRSESTKKQTQNQRNRNDSASSRWYGLGKKKWKYAHKHRGTIHYVGFFSSIRLAGDVAVIKAFALHSNVCVCVCEFTYVGMIAYIASVVVWSMVLHRPLGLVWMIFVIKLCERVSKCVRTYCAHAQTHSRTHINYPYTLKKQCAIHSQTAGPAQPLKYE